MSTERIEPIRRHTRLEVSLLGGPGGRWFLGRVDRCLPGELLVTLIADSDTMDSFTPNTPVRVRYVGDRALYWFTSKVTRQVLDGIRLVALAEPKNIFREQRRKSVRLEISVSLEYEVPCENRGVRRGRTLDLSANGLAFLSEVDLPVGTVLDLSMGLRQHGRFKARGEVVRSKPAATGKGKHIAVRFTHIDEKTQDRIMRFIFCQQSRLRRLGLL